MIQSWGTKGGGRKRERGGTNGVDRGRQGNSEGREGHILEQMGADVIKAEMRKRWILLPIPPLPHPWIKGKKIRWRYGETRSHAGSASRKVGME